MKFSAHTLAVLQALFVTFLWSTSWVLIKIGLADIPALTFAGLRYMLAFLCLLCFVFHPAALAALRHLSRRDWLGLLALGIIYYAVTQGMVFLSLVYLPAMTVSLFLSLTPILVALLGIALLSEHPTPLQWGGTLVFLVGAILFFYPIDFPASQFVGLIVAAICVLANALSSILGRYVNCNPKTTPLMVTVVSMGVGAAVLLVFGLLTQDLPRLEPMHWTIIAWLAVVNTAVAFTLWNRTLQTLAAMESSIINNTMLVQIAILAWVFLDEALTWQKILGMVLASVGAVTVQIRLTRS